MHSVQFSINKFESASPLKIAKCCSECSQQSKSTTFHGQTSDMSVHDKAYTYMLSKDNWERIQEILNKPKKDYECAEANRVERQSMRDMSKNMVKHWTNTIAGQRQKKLEARKHRENKEEEDRKAIDVEEALYQSKKRQTAIQNAKMLQYFEVDRVKKFHGALLLSEVLKERDAQIQNKQQQEISKKEQENTFLKEVAISFQSMTSLLLRV